VTALATGAPACLWVPPGVLGSYRDEVAGLMDLAGRPLDPHQLLAVEALTSYTTGGKWPTFVAGVEGPRQTVGKTGGILLPIALFLCLAFPEIADERTWTAHRLDTTSKTFRDARQLLGVDDPDRSRWRGELSERVANVGLENGNEHIEFVNGSVLWFKARSVRAGRGLSGHDVFADELLFATDEEFGALLPTMATRSAQGMPRLWTASSSAKAASSFLRRLRGRAVAGDPGVVYAGWWARGSWDRPGCERELMCSHAPGTPGCALDDPVLRHEANPGLGVRTSAAFLEEMRGTLSPLEFGREFLGWQETDSTEETIPLDLWGELADPASAVAGGCAPVFAVDVAPDRSMSAVAVAGRREDDLQHVGLVAHQRGDSWLVDRVCELNERHRPVAIVLDGASPASALLPELLNRGLEVWSQAKPWGVLVVTSASEMGQACGGLQSAVKRPYSPLRHRGDPIVRTALESAVRRDIGDGGWGWTRRRTEADITPLVALTLAHWGWSRFGNAGGLVF
jgi:hypothetical protein